MVSLSRIAQLSDIITLHVHLNNKTENLIDIKFLKRMKKSAIIINTSRGKIINEKDLLLALKEKIIYGAGLDVINGEWLNENERKNHALIQYAKKNKNLIITPHIGGATKESIINSRIFMAKKVATFLKRMKN